MKNHIDIYNADHPYTKAAIAIVEDYIEPLLERGLEGEEYHELEMGIVATINKYVHQNPELLI